jgi:phenylacetate-coenzyme A ligase PaaK-like adenylate-forming protein
VSYSTAHWERVGEETRRMVDEVPLYRDRPAPPIDPAALGHWLARVPAVGKRDLRKGFPKSLVRRNQDLHAAMRQQQVTLLATSGTTADRLQVIWEWSWWDPQEREAMRLNARVARTMRSGQYREAVLTTPACGAGVCHFGSQTVQERSIDGMLFFNESADPTHWTERECNRMLGEWSDFAPRGVEADPAYLAIIARVAE